MKDAAADSLMMQLWSAAARRSDGAGLEGGGSFGVVRSLCDQHKKAGRHDLAGVVVMVAARGQWTAERRSRLSYEPYGARACPKRGGVETLPQRCWECAWLFE